MNDTQYQQALAAAEKLTRRSDEALFEELGLRIKDIENIGGYGRAQAYSADFAQEAEEMLSTEGLKEIGRRWWKKLEPELLNLVCDEKNADLRKITSGKTLPQVAASLATAAVIATLAPPAWVIVATSILAAKITEAGFDALCEIWHESLEAGKSNP